MTITVNGVAIGDAEIAAEMQYHPASDVAAARSAATEALVVRELLMQEARRLGSDTQDSGVLDRLLAEHVPAPAADEATCRRYYDTHRRRFRTPELYEARHILISAAPDDPEAVARAKATAQALIAEIEREPDRYAALAAAHSTCPSKDAGGSLGQIGRKDIAPELATFLAALDEGQLCPVPVQTRHGYHVVRLDRRAPSAELPYEAVRDRIAAYLAEASWRRAVHQYISGLARRAKVIVLE